MSPKSIHCPLVLVNCCRQALASYILCTYNLLAIIEPFTYITKWHVVIYTTEALYS